MWVSPPRASTRLVPERGRALARRGRADAGERGRLRNGFEPLGPGTIVYATWKTVLSRSGDASTGLSKLARSATGTNFKIADMRARGHLWASTQHNAVPGLTSAGETLRQAAKQHNAKLLVVDTLGVANGASEIDRAQVGAFFADWAAWAVRTTAPCC